MIVKILQSSATFNAVSYNTDKVETGKGELVAVEGFGVLQGLEDIRPQDYVNYLMAQSARSPRTKHPQFHAVISCKGRSHSREELSSLAHQWIKGMGYGEQPYLLIFHKDTDNNHIHIVSTRVDRNGKKINDSFEKLKAYKVLDNILGVDRKEMKDKVLSDILGYGFSTLAQFKLLFERQGYIVREKGTILQAIKFGEVQSEIQREDVDLKMSSFKKDVGRLAQIRAIVYKYAQEYDITLSESSEAHNVRSARKQEYSSALTEMLNAKFGIEIVFHSSEGKPPYGYTIIDHKDKMVYKGGDLMPLSKLIGNVETDDVIQVPEVQNGKTEAKSSSSEDQPALKTSTEHLAPHRQETQNPEMPEMVGGSVGTIKEGPNVGDMLSGISPDIDDEAILGRNRRRKGKARTNTR